MRQEVLAEAAGEFQTPCYVFDLDRLREDVAEMKTLLADRAGTLFCDEGKSISDRGDGRNDGLY